MNRACAVLVVVPGLASPDHAAYIPLYRALSLEAMTQPDAWRMIRRRARHAGIQTKIGCHTFRATGITAYLENGGTLEHAQQIAAHESPRTTKLYDRTSDQITLDEIERIAIWPHEHESNYLPSFSLV